MPSEAAPSNSGIVTDDKGQRHIPESTRADGSTRKAIKIRPGYRPPEDVELYKNRTAEAFRNRGKSAGIPGAEGLKNVAPAAGASSAASNKNAKRREARKKAKAAEDGSSTPAAAGSDKAAPSVEAPADAAQSQEADPEVEQEKKVRNLRKKLKQARELEQKKEGGGSLLPEQIAKVVKISELVRELQALGIDTTSEAKDPPPAKKE